MSRGSARYTVQKISAILISVYCLSGCAVSVPPQLLSNDDVLLKQALAQREAAYARLTKAISTYCSISHERFAARQQCILEKQMELQGKLQGRGENRNDRIAMIRPEAVYGETGPTLQCEGAGLRVTCRRIAPALLELLMN